MDKEIEILECDDCPFKDTEVRKRKEDGTEGDVEVVKRCKLYVKGGMCKIEEKWGGGTQAINEYSDYIRVQEDMMSLERTILIRYMYQNKREGFVDRGVLDVLRSYNDRVEKIAKLKGIIGGVKQGKALPSGQGEQVGKPKSFQDMMQDMMKEADKEIAVEQETKRIIIKDRAKVLEAEVVGEDGKEADG